MPDSSWWNQHTTATIVITINGAALWHIVRVGYAIVRHLTRMEMKVDLMWRQFVAMFPHLAHAAEVHEADDQGATIVPAGGPNT